MLSKAAKAPRGYRALLLPSRASSVESLHWPCISTDIEHSKESRSSNGCQREGLATNLFNLDLQRSHPSPPVELQCRPSSSRVPLQLSSSIGQIPLRSNSHLSQVNLRPSQSCSTLLRAPASMSDPSDRARPIRGLLTTMTMPTLASSPPPDHLRAFMSPLVETLL